MCIRDRYYMEKSRNAYFSCYFRVKITYFWTHHIFEIFSIEYLFSAMHSNNLTYIMSEWFSMFTSNMYIAGIWKCVYFPKIMVKLAKYAIFIIIFVGHKNCNIWSTAHACYNTILMQWLAKICSTAHREYAIVTRLRSYLTFNWKI